MKRYPLIYCFLIAVIGMALMMLPAEAQVTNSAVIQLITFRTWRTLDSADLSRDLPLKIGSPYSSDDLATSIRLLYERGIFEHIDANVNQLSDGVEIEFLLTPAMTLFAVEFSGEHDLDERRLRRLAAVPLDRPLNMKDLLDARARIVTGYQREGFSNADVRVRVREREITPQVIATFVINEGYQSKISEAVIDTELPEDLSKLREQLRAAAVGQPASEAALKTIRQELLAGLRSEGYLQASVEMTTDPVNPETGDLGIHFQVQPRSPVSIDFFGNTVFSAAELLEPLRLESRTVPFTPSAIDNLCKEIDRMYEEKGYFFAQVKSQRPERQGERRIFAITIIEGQQVRLRKIEFKGNEALSDTELLAVMDTQPVGSWLTRRWSPGYLSTEAISNDLGAIESLYQHSAYLNASATFELKQTENPAELDLVINIDEGQLRFIESVEITWEGLLGGSASPEVDYSLLMFDTTIEAGQPFNFEKLQNEQTRFIGELRERGYPNAQVELVADPESRKVEFIAKPGIQVTVGKVQIAGNFFTHDHVIERELRMYPGHVLRPSDLRKTEQTLYELGIFRAVSVHPADGVLDSPVEDITVEVAERDTGSLQLETGFNTEDGLHLAGELGQRNLGGTGEALQLSIDGYFKTGDRLFDAGNARARFTEPHFLELPVDLFTELYAQYSIKLVDPFSYDRLGASSTVRVPISEQVSSSFGVNLFVEDLYDVPDDVIIDPDDAKETFFSFMNSQLEWDGRDNRYNPRSGHRSILQARLAAEAIGSQANILALAGQETVYLPVTQRLVWVNSARGDFMHPFGDTDVIPLSQRIFLGGRNSLRGFSKNVIGPRGVDGNIAGGDVSLVLNTELQYDLMENIIGLLFFDAGQTYLTEEGSFEGLNRDFSTLRYSPGFGLRYKTPIGPVSIEAGFALDREFGERWGRLNFAVGNAF